MGNMESCASWRSALVAAGLRQNSRCHHNLCNYNDLWLTCCRPPFSDDGRGLPKRATGGWVCYQGYSRRRVHPEVIHMFSTGVTC